MRVTADVERAAWLSRRMGGWATVAGVAGTGFARYARILHPVEARRLDLAVVDEWGQHPVVEEAVWPWREVAARNGRSMHPRVQWGRLVDPQDGQRWDDGWEVHQAPIGWFDPVALAALTDVLQRATTVDGITVAVWNGFGLPGRGVDIMVAVSDDTADEHAHLTRRAREDLARSYAAEFELAVLAGPHAEFPGREYVLLAGGVHELADADWGYAAGIGWFGSRHPSPQLVWPEDRAWVVATEIDWDSTIVAGSDQLIDALLADVRFEVFEVDGSSDLSSEGDVVNR